MFEKTTKETTKETFRAIGKTGVRAVIQVKSQGNDHNVMFSIVSNPHAGRESSDDWKTMERTDALLGTQARLQASLMQSIQEKLNEKGYPVSSHHDDVRGGQVFYLNFGEGGQDNSKFAPFEKDLRAVVDETTQAKRAEIKRVEGAYEKAARAKGRAAVR